MSEKVVGILVANDAEGHIDFVLDSLRGFIDELVFVDEHCGDNTAATVNRFCLINDIPLITCKHIPEDSHSDLLRKGLKAAEKSDAVWVFHIDPNVVLFDAASLRRLIEGRRFTQFWFKSLRLGGDTHHNFVAGFTATTMRLWKHNGDIFVDDWGYHCPSRYRMDPNSDRFLGWDLSYVQYADKIFYEHQRWYKYVWNVHYGTTLSTVQFMNAFFSTKATGEPTESYMRTFVLNRLVDLCKPAPKLAEHIGMSYDMFKDSFLVLPPALRSWRCPFKLILDEKHRIKGRAPDLMCTPVLDNNDIYQLANIEMYQGWLDV